MRQNVSRVADSRIKSKIAETGADSWGTLQGPYNNRVRAIACTSDGPESTEQPLLLTPVFAGEPEQQDGQGGLPQIRAHTNQIPGSKRSLRTVVRPRRGPLLTRLSSHTSKA